MISRDGRYLMFGSSATNLVPMDTNGLPDVFLRDRLAGLTEIVSVSSSGSQGDGFSWGVGSISADGQLVVFESNSTNLVPNDTNGAEDIFIRNRAAGTTTRVSLGFGGVEANGGSGYGSISADGRFLAFASSATNIVPGDANQAPDIFVRDLFTGVNERVSVTSGGLESNDISHYPVISDDGRYVAFMSQATNLVSGDTNGTWDVFVHDRQTGATVLISADPFGVPGNGQSSSSAISSDGRFVLFSSDSSNLVPNDTNGTEDAFVRDMVSGTTECVSVSTSGTLGNSYSFPWSISEDDRFVLFSSRASNLIAGDTNGVQDVFIRDRLLSTTERVSLASDGTQADGICWGGQVTPDGRFVLFSSIASTLVPGDTNAHRDVFVHDRFATGFTNFCDPGSGSALYCPCMNPPASSGRGCDNSSLTGGASLAASGIAYLSLDSLRFTTHDEKPSATSILLQSDTPAANGLVFGQGIRCAGGALKRMYVKTANNGSIQAPESSAGDPTISARSAALGVPIQPGQPYYYLVYYRDPVVLGGCSAFATFNCTQTGSVSYWP